MAERKPIDPKVNLNRFHNRIKASLQEYEKNLRTEHGVTLDFDALEELLNRKYKIDTSAAILKSMFSPPQDVNDTTRKIPLAEMICIALELGIPLEDVCKSAIAEDWLPDDEKDIPWLKNTDGAPVRQSQLHMLLDPHYYGEFYVYYFQTKQQTGMSLGGKTAADGLPIQEGILSIRQEGSATYATLISTDPKDDLVLRGKVALIDRSRQVFIRLTDADGLRLNCIMFSYKNYSVSALRYRTAALLSPSYNHLEAPLMEKIAIFRKRQNLHDPSAETVVRGILTLDSREILVEEAVFEKLAEEDAGYKKLPQNSRHFYAFHESDFASPALPWEFETRVRRLLQLRRVSNLEAQEIVEDSEDLALFFKQLQQEP